MREEDPIPVPMSKGVQVWRIARHPHASGGVDAVVIIAACTILLTRLTLRLLGYPRVGSGPLHIAHLLWGGLALTVATLTALAVLGDRVRPVTIALAGIGLGLGLDEIGKFVTTNNDYFYKPAVAVMYVLLVTVVVTSRLVRDMVPRRAHENLAAAAFIAADGVVHGLDNDRRIRALDYLARVDTDARRQVEAITALLESCVERQPPRARQRWSRIADSRVVRRLDDKIWIRLCAIALVAYSAFGLASAIKLGLESTDDVTQFAQTVDAVGSLFVLVLALPALVWRIDRRWVLEAVRLSSIITLVFIQVIEFAQSQFSALGDLLIGLVTLALISRAISRARDIDGDRHR